MVKNVCNCKHCKKDINKNDDKWLRDKNNNYHYDCYIEKMSSKKNAIKVLVQMEADELLKENEKKLLSAKEKDEFYKYIQYKYGITIIPSCIFTKMSAIFSGEFKGQSQPIEASDLLIMFQTKESALERVYAKNKVKGKVLDSVSRFNYDLAIMLSQYDNYRMAKEKQANVGLSHSGDVKVSELLEKSEYINSVNSINYIVHDNEKIENERILDDLDIQKYVDEI